MGRTEELMYIFMMGLHGLSLRGSGFLFSHWALGLGTTSDLETQQKNYDFLSSGC